MAFEGTATRKRPQSFDQIAGQEFVVATIRNSIRQNRIAHAYLFSGPRGVGKTSAARILAKALNCEQGPTDAPCGTCASCQEIARGNSLDVIEIDGASNTSVNDVREIKDEVLFTPNRSRYKVYIIDEVHMLSNSAFNALLKTIEEPPPYIVFILATTEVHKVPATIRSRCQQFNFRVINSEQIHKLLGDVVQEMNIKAEDQALFWIAKEATGSLRDAYTLLDQIAAFSGEKITLEKIREKLGIVGSEEIAKIGDIIINGDKKEILQFFAAILEKGVSVEQFVIDLADFFRNLLLFKTGVRAESLFTVASARFDEKLISSLSIEQIEKAIEMLLELYRGLRFSLNQRFDCELVMSRLCDLPRLISHREVLEAIQTVREELGVTPIPPVLSKIRESRGGNAASDLLHRLAEAVRKEKPSLAASLDNASSFSLSADELTLSFPAKDRFSGEQVLKEREAVLKAFSMIQDGPKAIRLRTRYLEPEVPKGTAHEEQVEIVKRVFRGQVVKGGADGDQSL